MPRGYSPCFASGYQYTTADPTLFDVVVIFDSDERIYEYLDLTETDWTNLRDSLQRGEDYNASWRANWTDYQELSEIPQGSIDEFTA
jgi:hypothetical protein